MVIKLFENFDVAFYISEVYKIVFIVFFFYEILRGREYFCDYTCFVWIYCSGVY